ncbi:putative flippase GtrA [Stenotrophomonas sp. AG209]|uniref:GtrA family protein n=1 Tax=Stenotrophomonas TaxID=40323 RepID=UPI000E5AD369|nr:GtrA family protein [Stenotrophomonas sp. AG209]MBH1528454.1 GtrA family protein [Stenotrophomonas maltophilia]RIA20185.1 putative flippase GtrA [Stenotrophomonas sp. AG209]
MSRQFLLFIICGGTAAAVNVGSRILFSLAVPFEVAVCLAYGLGMLTAFILNRVLVFKGSDRPIGQQAAWFIAINAVSLLQTLAISVLLKRWLLPLLNWPLDIPLSAHLVGVAVPIFTAYLGHKHFTFARSKAG